MTENGLFGVAGGEGGEERVETEEAGSLDEENRRELFIEEGRTPTFALYSSLPLKALLTISLGGKTLFGHIFFYFSLLSFIAAN